VSPFLVVSGEGGATYKTTTGPLVFTRAG